MDPENKFVQNCIKEYKERRNSAINILTKYDSLKEYIPDGAFYCLIPIRTWLDRNKDWLQTNAVTTPHTEIFCQQLLKEYQVAVSPGETFGKNSSEYIRVSLAQDKDTVEEGMERLCTFIELWRKGFRLG